MIRAFDIWLWPYLTRERHRPTGEKPQVLFAVCDHFEPFHDTDRSGALQRMEYWERELPKTVGEIQGAGGIPPRHTFFFPIEQYDEEVVSRLAELCRKTGCETEIHLHHENDTIDSLRAILERGKEDLGRHGLLSRDAKGEVRYAFIHGDWALDNSHPDGLHCGVNGELGLLRQTGCYADFTLPSVPSRTQTRTVNSLYYAKSTPSPKSHDTGIRVRAGQDPTSPLRDDPNHLLLVQGPLGLNWRWRKWGLVPRIENADVTCANPPTAPRFALWQELGIHISGRRDVIFVKLHTHGALERNAPAVVGGTARSFHQALQARDDIDVHYVTAREMVNVLHGIEDGSDRPVGELRDYLYSPPSTDG